MNAICELEGVMKVFDGLMALNGVTVSVAEGSVVGLVGSNGAGKTTLLHHVTGLILPSRGECRTFGRPAADLRSEEMARIGVVAQDGDLPGWLTVAGLIAYVAGFHERWDAELAGRLLRDLELAPAQLVGELSSGSRQKLGVLLGLGHHPELLLLDEPFNAVDPIGRGTLLELLLERVREDGCTTVISSHQLHDIEKMIDHVICLDKGRVVEDAPLDTLKETYVEWIVTARGDDLPPVFPEEFVLQREGGARQARLLVRCAEADQGAFRERYAAEIVSLSLDLEKLFPMLVGRETQ